MGHELLCYNLLPLGFPYIALMSLDSRTARGKLDERHYSLLSYMLKPIESHGAPIATTPRSYLSGNNVDKIANFYDK
jgi:hypothetical protein